MYKGRTCSSSTMNEELAEISKERGIVVSTAAGNGWLYITYEVPDNGVKDV